MARKRRTRFAVQQRQSSQQRLIDQALSSDIKQTPADAELLEVAAMQGLMPKPAPPGPEGFTGDFRSMIARYLYEQRLGMRATFRDYTAFGIGVPAYQESQLCRVEVPPWLATDWTITLSPPGSKGNAQGDVFPLDQLDLYAEIEWGTSGGKAKVQIDWGRGARFSIPAASISILAVLPGTTAIGGGPFGYPMTVTAQIVPGTAVSKPMALTRTVYMGRLTSGTETAVHPIPAFAKLMRMTNQTGHGRSIDVTWYMNGGTFAYGEYGIITGAADRSDGDFIDWQPVPRYATGFSMTAVGIGNVEYANAVFALEL